MSQGAKVRLGHEGRAIRRVDGKVVDNDDVIFAQVMMRKGADSGPTLEKLHAKVDQLNNGGILPPGVRLERMIDRSDLLAFTLDTVVHNLGEGMILVSIILFLFLLNTRAALIVSLTIPFSLLFASILLDLTKVPVNLLSLGALDFGMVVDGAVVMIENIVRHMGRRQSSVPTSGRITVTVKIPPKSSARRRMKCSDRCSTPSSSSSPRTCPSSRCSAWKDDCSGPWPGRSPLPRSAR